MMLDLMGVELFHSQMAGCGEFGKTIIIVGVNNSFSVHVGNRKKIY